MFELAQPWILILILLAPLLWYLLPAVKNNFSTALKLPFYHAITQNFATNNSDKSRHAWLIPFTCWCLLVIALAGPRWVGSPISLTREGRNIMLVLDLSGSMALTDAPLNGRHVSRLTVVKQAALDFIQQRVEDKIGLIVFGTRAYVQSPLTYDRQHVSLAVSDSTPGLAGNTTSIGDGLGLAVKQLQPLPASSRVIILLTDGVNNSGLLAPLEAAKLAKEVGIKVYTIGLSVTVNPWASNPEADLDENTLKKMAKLTNARYFRATDPLTLKKIYSTINQLETVANDTQKIFPQIEYYPWPLAAALVLMLSVLFKKQVKR